MKWKEYKKGIQNGIPICFGYFAVSFTFGMLAKKEGLTGLQAVLISLTNLTSAGQFAGLSLIVSNGGLFEMGDCLLRGQASSVSRITPCAMPGTLFPSLKLTGDSNAPVGTNRTLFKSPFFILYIM